MCRLLKWGVDTSPSQTNDGTRYKWTFEPTQDLLCFSTELSPGIGTYARRVINSLVSSIAVEAAAREVVTSTISILGGKEKLVTPQSSPNFSTLPPFVFHQGAVSGLVTANVEAFRFTYENALFEDAFALGSRFLPSVSLKPGAISLTGDLDLAFQDWATYQKFLGSASATEPLGELTAYSLTLDLTGPSAGGAGEYSNYRFKVEIPVLYLDTSEANFDRRERIVQAVGFTAIAPDLTTNPLVRFTIVNKLSSF